MNSMHQANRGYWNEAAEWWERLEEEGGLWKRCPYEPDLAFDEGGSLGLVREAAGTMSGKDVCVVGSGDNHAAFAFAGMGANVTSVDISERLAVASRRAGRLGLPITIRAGWRCRPWCYRERGVRPGLFLQRVLRLDRRPAAGLQRDIPYPASRRTLRLLRYPPVPSGPGKIRSCRSRLRSRTGKPRLRWRRGSGRRPPGPAGMDSTSCELDSSQ